MPRPRNALTKPTEPTVATPPSTPTTDELLRALLATAGRVAVPPDLLRTTISPSGAPKYIHAYNLCDGTRAAADIARLAQLDLSNLSKVVTRWVDAGVLFKVGEVPNLLHLYRLPGGASGEPSDGGDAKASAARRRAVSTKPTPAKLRTNGKAPDQPVRTEQADT